MLIFVAGLNCAGILDADGRSRSDEDVAGYREVMANVGRVFDGIAGDPNALTGLLSLWVRDAVDPIVANLPIRAAVHDDEGRDAATSLNHMVAVDVEARATNRTDRAAAVIVSVEIGSPYLHTPCPVRESKAVSAVADETAILDQPIGSAERDDALRVGKHLAVGILPVVTEIPERTPSNGNVGGASESHTWAAGAAFESCRAARLSGWTVPLEDDPIDQEVASADEV